ncbi:hypothetical protein BGZ83_007019 [Gryganskiella cystojenkinii]|nr:hypothetical protein BGZ83_007019 [Gryganskiella cystojenkinii]
MRKSEEDLLAPTRTVPAQLNRSETTSYVIHRTFEDFQHLSEMVLSLQDQLDHDQHNKHNNNNNHKNTPFSSSSQYQDSNNYTEGQQHLRALRLHHPHPSLFYTLVKQFLFSNAKANQRAFDASSTTHGFDEEGAYERIIELTQFLEEVWHRLLFTTEEPCFYQEQHEIMLWFKPSTDSSHPDGRQMRDRQEQDQKRLQALQQQYQRTTTPALAKKRVTIEASPTLVEQPHLQHDYNLSMSSGSSSTASMPALSSPSSSSVSSMSTSAVGNHEELVGHASSSPTVSDYDNPMENAHLNSTEAVVYDETTNHNKNDDLRRRHTICEGTKKSVGSHLNPTEKITAQDHVPSDHQSTTTTLQSDLEPMPVFKPRNNKRSSTLGNTSGTAASSGADKIKRRISFSHVFRSLTSSSYQRHYPNGHPAKSASSASTPTSPRMDSFDEILIWNTVTSKNTPKHAL